MHYNGANSYLFVNGTKIIKFKAKDSEIVATPLCLGKISKVWSVDNRKKTGFNGYIFYFSLDYAAIAVDDISDIHSYLMKKITKCNKMLGFIKKCFFTGLAFLSVLTGINSLSCISKTSKCSSSYNNVNNSYAKICVSDVVKKLNVKVFNLMSINNEARCIEWYETCKCECRLDASACNNKQRWNDDKCRCKCKELIDKRVCDKGFIWNPSNCDCECDKSCDIGEYLDYESCKCRKTLVDKLIEKCTKNIDEVNIVENKHKCSSCTLYIVLFSISFTINVGIGTYFAYKCMNH